MAYDVRLGGALAMSVILQMQGENGEVVMFVLYKR